MSSLSDPPSDDLVRFAAALAHELRTPLSALSGEVDVALRRDRPAAAYREALTRIAGAVAELVELTGDLTFLGEAAEVEIVPTRTARLDVILARVIARYASDTESAFAVEPVATTAVVAGDEALLTRALTLVVQHAVRHRRGGSQVRLRVASPDDPAAGAGPVHLIIETAGGGFWPRAWQCLGATPPDGDAGEPIAAPLRLRTADSILRRCGGSLDAASADGADGVHIRLRSAVPA